MGSESRLLSMSAQSQNTTGSPGTGFRRMAIHSFQPVTKKRCRVLLHGKIPLFSEIIAMQKPRRGSDHWRRRANTAVVVAAIPGGAAEADGITMLGNGDIHHRRLAGLAIDGSRRQQALKLNPGEAVVLAGLIGPLVGLEVEEAARGPAPASRRYRR